MMYRKNTLRNGLRIITSNMPHMESVSIGVWIGVGGRYEEKKLCGMSHVLEHMLFKGTIKRTTNMLKESIEGIGGSFNGFTSEEVTCYLVKLPASHVDLGLDVLSDMVLNPKLDPIELEKEKYVICEEIKMYFDQPSHHVFDILAQAMWPHHPLGRPIAGFNDTVKSFKREDLVRFKDMYYQPANMSVVVSGRVGPRDKRVAFLEKVFSRPSTRRNFACEPVKKSHKASATRLFYKDTQQTHLALGFHGIARENNLRYALLLLHIILGGNMSSRLFERLREKKALCYDISSSVKRYRETSIFVIHSGVDNANCLEAIREIVHELGDVKRSLVTSDELMRAKEYAKGQMLLALEDTASRMIWLGERIMQEGKAPSVKEILNGIEKVTLEDVRRVANIVFNEKNLNFATVGSVTKNFKTKLRKIFTVLHRGDHNGQN